MEKKLLSKSNRLQVLREPLYCLETEVSDDYDAGNEQRKEVGMLYSISCWSLLANIQWLSGGLKKADQKAWSNNGKLDSLIYN